ncbi:unnamed protein product [Closterium sp. Yama58-4]|nr:unnamed protein product [Closterium sp. Yama58-4]
MERAPIKGPLRSHMKEKVRSVALPPRYISTITSSTVFSARHVSSPRARDRLLWDMRASASPSASAHAPLASHSAIHSPLSPSSLSLSKPHSLSSTSSSSHSHSLSHSLSQSHSHSLSHSHSPSSLSQPVVSSTPLPSSLAALHPLLASQSHPSTSAALACMGAQQPGGTARAESCWQGGARVRREAGEREGGAELDGGVRGDEQMEGVAMGGRGEGEGEAECGRAVAGVAGYGSNPAGWNGGLRGEQLDSARSMGAEGRGARPELRRVLFGELQRLQGGGGHGEGGCDVPIGGAGGDMTGQGMALGRERQWHTSTAERGEQELGARGHEWSSCSGMHDGGDGARGRGEWDSDEEAAGRWEDADGVLQLSAEEYEALLLDMQRALYEDDGDDDHLPPYPSGHRSMDDQEEEAYQQGMEDAEIMAALAYQKVLSLRACYVFFLAVLS